MDSNNHQKTLKICTQPIMCTPYIIVKCLTKEDIRVMTMKKSDKTEHMKKCLDLSYLENVKKEERILITKDEIEKGSVRKPIVSSSNISGNNNFQQLNQTNLKKKSLTNSTAISLSSSSSEIIQKPKLNNMKMENKTSYSHTISSPSSSSLQSSKKSMKRKLSDEQSYNHTISFPSSSGLQSSKQSMKQKLSNVKIKNESFTCLQFNGHFKNISKNRRSSEDLIGKIWIRDPKDMVKPSLYEDYKMSHLKVIDTKYFIKNRRGISKPKDETDLQLHEFTFLFDKYFVIPLQQTIVVIANIANAILLCENFYNERKDAFQRNILNIEILQGHKIVLVSKLQKYLMMILYSIDECDVYNMALILFMCMLSIIPSLHVIQLNWDDTLKNLVQLFCNNLERSQPRFLKFINCIENHTFHSVCNNLVKLFDVAARLDYTMKNRMAIFFKPKKTTTNYFKRVNRAIRRNSNDTGFFLKLVNESSKNLRDSCKFKEPQGIFLKNNPPTISKNITNDENKKPTYLRRSNRNTTSKNTANANLKTSLKNSASNITNGEPNDLNFNSTYDADNCNNRETVASTVYCSKYYRLRHQTSWKYKCGLVNNRI